MKKDGFIELIGQIQDANELLSAESTNGQAVLYLFDDLTAIVNKLRALKIPTDKDKLNFLMIQLRHEPEKEYINDILNHLVRICDRYFKTYDSSEEYLSSKYSLDSLKKILKERFNDVPLLPYQCEVNNLSRIYDSLKNNPEAVIEEIDVITQKLQDAQSKLEVKQSECDRIVCEHISVTVTDPYYEIATQIRPLYEFLKKELADFNIGQNNSLTITEKGKPGRHKKDTEKSITEFFIYEKDYTILKKRLIEFFKQTHKKASPMDISILYQQLRVKPNEFMTDKVTSLKRFAELLQADTGKEIFANSINSLYQVKGRVTFGFKEKVKGWLLEIKRERSK